MFPCCPHKTCPDSVPSFSLEHLQEMQQTVKFVYGTQIVFKEPSAYG